MPATRAEARDQVLGVITAAALAAGIAQDRIVYDDKAGRKPESDSPSLLPWLRVLFRHAGSDQRSLTGDLGRVRFVRGGTLTVQIFTPGGDGLASADTLSAALLASVEGKTTAGGVQFFEATANGIGPDGPWFFTLMTARVEYDEFVTT
jgi:hypothetical protein